MVYASNHSSKLIKNDKQSLGQATFYSCLPWWNFARPAYVIQGSNCLPTGQVTFYSYLSWLNFASPAYVIHGSYCLTTGQVTFYSYLPWWNFASPAYVIQGSMAGNFKKWNFASLNYVLHGNSLILQPESMADNYHIYLCRRRHRI